MLSGALASSPLPAKMEASRAADDACTTKTVRSLRLCSLGSQISFVPNLRAYRGMLGRACCRLPTATLRCVVGRRALACAPGHCVRNGRVSGDWRVWACWIPARAATTSPASRLSRRPKRHLALAEVGFLCCIPIARAFCCPERPVSALRRASLGVAARGGPRSTRCVPLPAHACTCSGCWPMALSPDLSDAEHTVGMRPAASVCPGKQAFYASCERRPSPFWARPMRATGSVRNATCYSLFDGTCYSDNRSNSRANTCNKPRLLEGMHLLDKNDAAKWPARSALVCTGRLVPSAGDALLVLTGRVVPPALF
ncbi:UNVERIFIED_CONTAM: hypothetical protein Slati_1750900 [Sesamum latifolium]|uniref:Uncharacterized protein n=1 Tax=Sesamum latifolium TaxID=2727402 RepID=A0AAW2WX12_9LAMI